jgi:hypothetical protein
MWSVTLEGMDLLDATSVQPAFNLRRSTRLWWSVFIADKQRETIGIAALPLTVTRTSHAAVVLILLLGRQSVATDWDRRSVNIQPNKWCSELDLQHSAPYSIPAYLKPPSSQKSMQVSGVISVPLT